MKKIFSFDALFLIFIPIGSVIIEQVIKKALGYYDLNISLTLSSIALGQIFPFILFENLLLNKIFKLTPNYVTTGNTFQVTYSFTNNKTPAGIDKTKKMAYFLFVVCIVLFVVNVYCSYRGQGLFEKNIFGVANSLLVWSFLIFS